MEAFPSLGLRLAVHQRVGTDHLRTGKPIEDVVLHACPCGPFGAASALFCVFDGHSGIQAAEKARAIVPGMLASKLQVGGWHAHGFAGRPTGWAAGHCTAGQWVHSILSR